MTTYRVRATTHRAQVRVIGPTCDLSGPRANQRVHVRGEERRQLARLGELHP